MDSHCGRRRRRMWRRIHDSQEELSQWIRSHAARIPWAATPDNPRTSDEGRRRCAAIKKKNPSQKREFPHWSTN